MIALGGLAELANACGRAGPEFSAQKIDNQKNIGGLMPVEKPLSWNGDGQTVTSLTMSAILQGSAAARDAAIESMLKQSGLEKPLENFEITIGGLENSMSVD